VSHQLRGRGGVRALEIGAKHRANVARSLNLGDMDEISAVRGAAQCR